MKLSNLQKTTLKLLCVSFVILFQELLLIRWLGLQVRVLAYFPNIILMSAFLGIGLGCLRSGKKSLFLAWPGTLLLLGGATAVLSGVVFTQESMSEYLWLLYYDLPKGAPVMKGLYFPLLCMFVLNALSFIPLGQILADCIAECQKLRSSLWGYLWDIVGSSLGVAAFSLVSFLRWGPTAWFFVLGLCGVFLASRRHRVWVALAGVALVAGAHQLDRAHRYSPYYAITLQSLGSETGMTAVLANGSLHQYAMPLKLEDQIGADYSRQARVGYHFPYRVLPKKPRRVLVLGAGNGNDVAVALDEGAEQVDAVEIDPVILEAGRRVHPNQPYQSPKVRVFNTDARSFLNSTQETYDLIVFGTLDSMTRLSALSNVRLDNFVYTVESLQSARKRLAPDGGVVMYFLVGQSYLGERLAGILSDVFSEYPLVVKQSYGVFNGIFMVGPAFDAQKGPERRAIAESVRSERSQVLLPHDDWPYLYLKEKSVDAFYWQIGSAILLLSVSGVFLASKRLRQSAQALKTIDWEMLLFGMAFLLLETRGMIAMNLLWGATWFTNAVVIQCIFVTILLGTLLTMKWQMPFRGAMAGILASLALVYLCPLGQLLSMNPLLKFIVSIVMIGLPVFFASIAFALLFVRRDDPAVAFGWNLLGAVLGGLMEILSMVIGLKNLILLAMACYLAAMLVHERLSGLRPRKKEALPA